LIHAEDIGRPRRRKDDVKVAGSGHQATKNDEML
jgi:hypothetical protein